MEEKVKDSIYVKQPIPKVNDRLAAKLTETKGAKEVLSDQRFSKLFTDKDFEVDEERQVAQRTKKIAKRTGI